MYLLQFDDADGAAAALGVLLGDCLATALVTQDAVYDPDTGEPTAPREALPGYWLLADEAGMPGVVAEIDGAHVLATTDDAILGARLDPVYAGMVAEPLAMVPPAEPEPEPVRIVYKADIWRRATDDEAEAMDAMLESQPVRLRRMWADAVHLQTDDELYATIAAALTAAFGASRVSELLA